MDDAPRTEMAAPAAEAAIRRTVAAAQAHQNNVEPFLALHTADTAIVNIAGRRVLGRAALRAAMRQALAGPLADVRTETEVVDIRFVRPDVAVVSCVKRVFDERDPAPAAGGARLPTTGSLTYVVVREAGAWLIAAAQTTPVAG